MTKSEEDLLAALALMAQQYLSAPNESLDHMCMSAGEQALEQLHKYGLVTDTSRGAQWTDKGEEWLAKH